MSSFGYRTMRSFRAAALQTFRNCRALAVTNSIDEEIRCHCMLGSSWRTDESFANSWVLGEQGNEVESEVICYQGGDYRALLEKSRAGLYGTDSSVFSRVVPGGRDGVYLYYRSDSKQPLFVVTQKPAFGYLDLRSRSLQVSSFYKLFSI